MKNLFGQRSIKTICVLILIVWTQYGCSSNNSGSVNSTSEGNLTTTLEEVNVSPAPEAEYALKLIGVWPSGGSRAIAADGENDLVFIGIGAGIAVLDTHNPESITKLSQIPISDIVKDLFYDSGKLYVAAGRTGGFYIIDVGNPNAPKKIMQYDTPGSASAVFVRDKFAFIADGYDGGLRILDINTLDSPVEIGHYETAGVADGICVSGSYAFLADGFMGLKVFDISEPKTPQLIGENDTDTDYIFVNGEYAYIVSNVLGSNFVIMDISNPYNPTVTSKTLVRGGYPREIYVSEGVAYIACGSNSRALELVNIEDPYNPVLIDHYNLHTDYYKSQVEGVSIIGNRAFIKTSVGIKVIDVDDYTGIKKIGEYNYYPSIKNFSIYGSYAYVTNGNLTILDLNDLHNPKLVTDQVTPGDAEGVKATGDYVYIGDDREGLRILDVKNPYLPKDIGHYECSGRIGPIYVSGSYVYFAEGSDLSLIDVSVPSNPTAPHSVLEQAKKSTSISISIGNSEAQPREVFVSGTKAYITKPGRGSWESGGNLGGISIIDIRNPMQLEKVGSYSPGSFNIWDVYVVGNIAYIADREKLRIVDFENPLDPITINTVDTNWARSITVSGDYAVVADGLLRVFDVRDLNNPREIANYPIPRRIKKIEMIDNYIYFADTYAGLFIIELITIDN